MPPLKKTHARVHMLRRTFNDLTQYPVFPFVLADYTSETLDLTDPATFRDLSKPMGAQDETRLRRILTQYENLREDREDAWHYGTHYSNIGYPVSNCGGVGRDCVEHGKNGGGGRSLSASRRHQRLRWSNTGAPPAATRGSPCLISPFFLRMQVGPLLPGSRGAVYELLPGAPGRL